VIATISQLHGPALLRGFFLKGLFTQGTLVAENLSSVGMAACSCNHRADPNSSLLSTDNRGSTQR
jgi:hypothetical protein